MDRLVHIPTGGITLEGNLNVPLGATGIVVFAHGSDSGRHSPRNRFVAKVFNAAGLGTLLMDLLTLDERVVGAIDWVKAQGETKDLQIGLMGSSTGAASALVAASLRPKDVSAVVSKGGTPNLAEKALAKVMAPTLMIVGELDSEGIQLNKEAKEEMKGDVSLKIVPGATHLFEEPGTLEYAAELSRDWFMRYL